jgi:succinoglycan biosynthesis protein ExoA
MAAIGRIWRKTYRDSIENLTLKINIMLHFPSITIAIPTYNEADYIEEIVRAFLQTNYPNLIEVVVADGASTDGTQEIVLRLAIEDPRVKLLHNPQKIQSAALNLILENCSGDIFLRADAHSDYASDYIEKCVEALLESQSWNVGGAQRFVAKSAFQAGMALASRSILGNGGAKYRDPHYDGYGDTVYLGCFWTKNLRQLGGYCIEDTHNEDAALNLSLIETFDRAQLRNQDYKLNNTLTNIQPQAIYISSKIKVWYFPRNTWKSVCVQYFKYGKAKYLTTVKYKNQTQLRGKLPFIIISAMIALLSIDLLFPDLGLHFKEIFIVSLTVPFLESLRITRKFSQNFESEFWRGNKQQIPSVLSRWFFCGVSLLTMPISHFSGYTFQLFRACLKA